MRIFLCGGGDGIQTANAYKKLNETIDHTKPLLYIPLAMESDKYSRLLNLKILQKIKNVLDKGYSLKYYKNANLYRKDNKQKVLVAEKMIKL